MWSTGYSAALACGPASTACPLGWEWERRFRVWVLAGTLLGPEETGSSAPDRVAFGLRVMGLGCFFWTGSDAAHLVGCGWSGGLGCFLRTTQWTRASLIEAHSFWGGFRSAIC